MALPIQFDWSQGWAFVQDGTIFYSPNCSRRVFLPAQASSSSPFDLEPLDISMFRQPVWWSDVYGWQSFIPLAPSYTSSPFDPFCWMPRIVEAYVLVDPKSASNTRERRYEMHPDDCSIWRKREKLLTEAAEHIRIWFKIPGNLPPPPSMFNYGGLHRSRGIARKIISLARNWFAIWMGFVSYLIASTERFYPSASPFYSRPDPDSPFPVWYHRLQERHGYPAAWLDGLTSSTVCSYDIRTQRVGVVFEWSKADRTRLPIKWFFEHQIPMWFIWSKEEEQALLRDRSYAFLQPPNHLIQDALTLLFSNPTSRIPLAGLIIQRYYNMGSDPVTNETIKLLKIKEAPSFALKYTTGIFLDQEKLLSKVDSQTDAALSAIVRTKRNQQRAAARAEAILPTQTMLEGLEEKGNLFNHWREFLLKREKRQEEIIRVETPKERQKRLSREKKPGVQNADMYTWERIQSSGGKEVYMRLRVSKKRNENVFASYKSHQRIYNSLTNEWDLCREFDANVGEDLKENRRITCIDYDDSDSDEDFDCLHNPYTEDTPHEQPSTPPASVEHRLSTPPRSTLIEHKSMTPPRSDRMDVAEDDEDMSPFLHYSQDIVQTLSYGYGYVPSMSGSSNTQVSNKDWEDLLLTLGFVSPLSELDVEDSERPAISDFFSAMVKKTSLPTSSDDLNDLNHAALRHLFDFPAIHRPCSDLFVFSAPRSMASNWLLGVHSPENALYVCRYILSNPEAHTIVTVATRLLERGIPFRTLLGLECSSRHTSIIQPYSPPSFRLNNHVFTSQDFEASMLRCQAILSQPQGRAALLQGGIIWRIAKEFLSVDGVLSGPSIEVTLHRAGYMCPSGTPGTQYCDDALTENEIAIICGTYSLYTEMGQVSIKSWFPPPVCWGKDRTGVKWVEWTARNEQFFVDWLRDARAGKVKPLTVVEWTSRLRGFKAARVLRDNNRNRASLFMEQLVPAPEQLPPA